MLVLTRRINEEIVIDGNIRVRVTAVKGDKVRIGISAPPHVRVDRSEFHERRANLEDELKPRPTVSPRVRPWREPLRERRLA